MKAHFSRYIRSLFLNKSIIITLAIDVLTVLLISLSWSFFNKALEWRLYLLTGGKSVETLKTTLLSGSAETTQLFLHNTKIFAYLFFIGIIVLLLFTLFLSAASQYAVWSVLTPKRITFSYKTTLSWCRVFLLFVLFSAGAFVLYSGLLLLVNFLLPANQLLTAITVGMIKSFSIILFLVWSLLVLFYFNEKKQILESMNTSFQWIKTHRQNFLILLLFAGVTFILLNLLLQRLLPLGFMMTASAPFLFFIRLGVFLIYFNWLRWFIFNELNREQEAK
ncbi:hypothetical protein HYT55_05555 [Candidatus Woesearchaeota archaeon]|nr:hypothetical protein [Candidatus Woesearchaeota archaeon]